MICDNNFCGFIQHSKLKTCPTILGLLDIIKKNTINIEMFQNNKRILDIYLKKMKIDLNVDHILKILYNNQKKYKIIMEDNGDTYIKRIDHQLISMLIRDNNKIKKFKVCFDVNTFTSNLNKYSLLSQSRNNVKRKRSFSSITNNNNTMNKKTKTKHNFS